MFLSFPRKFSKTGMEE